MQVYLSRVSESVIEAESATCFDHATTSSFHFSVCVCVPFVKTSGAGIGVAA